MTTAKDIIDAAILRHRAAVRPMEDIVSEPGSAHATAWRHIGAINALEAVTQAIVAPDVEEADVDG